MIDPAEIEEFPNFRHDYEGCSDYKKRFRERCRAKTGLKTWKDWQPVVARCYENMIQVDAALGKVLDMLDSTGLAENTVVMLTADHGDALAVSGGLFDKGAMMIEETMSIPMVVRWPGVTKPGTRSNALVTNMDFVPTVLEISGLGLPKGMDGRSLVPVLKNPDAEWPEALMCEHHGHGSPAFQRLLYYKNYKYLAHLNDKHELYDLEKDPYEMVNRIDDPALSEVLRDIRIRLVKIMDDRGDNYEDANMLRKEMNI
jgi:arylsulfatase A-like enzyme